LLRPTILPPIKRREATMHPDHLMLPDAPPAKTAILRADSLRADLLYDYLVYVAGDLEALIYGYEDQGAEEFDFFIEDVRATLDNDFGPRSPAYEYLPTTLMRAPNGRFLQAREVYRLAGEELRDALDAPGPISERLDDVQRARDFVQAVINALYAEPERASRA